MQKKEFFLLIALLIFGALSFFIIFHSITSIVAPSFATNYGYDVIYSGETVNARYLEIICGNNS